LLVDPGILEYDLLNYDLFKSIYHYKFEFASIEDIKNAILENDESKAYICIVEEKVGVYVIYICNTKTGKVYTHKHSVIQSIGSRANK